MGRNVIYNDGLNKWQRYRLKMKDTPLYRAQYQVRSYRRDDVNNGFGDVIDFDAQWVIDNIYSKQCIYCGETDWKKLGCDRIDNTKPHTKDNVVCSCWECNNERQKQTFEEFYRNKKNKGLTSPS